MEQQLSLVTKIVEKYRIPKELAVNLIVSRNDPLWRDRIQLGAELKARAKRIDNTLARLGLYDLETKKPTLKAILRNYVRFAPNKLGNPKHLYNKSTVNSLVFAKKIASREKRRVRQREDRKKASLQRKKKKLLEGQKKILAENS